LNKQFNKFILFTVLNIKLELFTEYILINK